MIQTVETPLESGARALWETPCRAIQTNQPPVLLQVAVSCVRQNYTPQVMPLTGAGSGIEIEGILGQDQMSLGHLGDFNPCIGTNPADYIAYDPYGNPNPICGSTGFIVRGSLIGSVVAQPVQKRAQLGVNGVSMYFGFSFPPLGGVNLIELPFTNGYFNVNDLFFTGIVAYPKIDTGYAIEYYCPTSNGGEPGPPPFGGDPVLPPLPGWDLGYFSVPSATFLQSYYYRKDALTGTSVVLNPGSSGGSVSLHTIHGDGVTLDPADPANIKAVAGTGALQTFNGPTDMAQIIWFFRAPKDVPSTANGGVSFTPTSAPGGNLLYVK